MKKAKAIISATYIFTLLIDVFCLPLSAIFIIFKLCDTSSMSWIGCFIPVIIVLFLTPVTVISKLIIDEKAR